MKSANDIAANAIARAQVAAAATNPETALLRGFEGGKRFERERIANMIENMEDGSITTKAVRSYIAARIRESGDQAEG